MKMSLIFRLVSTIKEYREVLCNVIDFTTLSCTGYTVVSAKLHVF